MSGEAPALVVAIEIGEPELADRLAALLADAALAAFFVWVYRGSSTAHHSDLIE